MIAISKTNRRTIIVDVLLVAAACFIPAASHLVALPLYHADPMRWLLLAGLLIVANHKNGYLLAIALPLAACLLSGMPTPAKAVIIALELSANVAVYYWLEKKMAILPAMFIGIVASKLVYYSLKALFLNYTVLIGTSIWLQVALVALMAFVFARVMKMRENR